MIVFDSRRNLILTLANVPFAMVGGVLALWLSQRLGAAGQRGLSIGSLVGFVTLFGITMRNSIMMISHFDHLVQCEGASWGVETALRGASERLLPILMNALVTGLGLLPLALGAGEAGREIEGPMAVVILGGLLLDGAQPAGAPRAGAALRSLWPRSPRLPLTRFVDGAPLDVAGLLPCDPLPRARPRAARSRLDPADRLRGSLGLGRGRAQASRAPRSRARSAPRTRS